MRIKKTSLVRDSHFLLGQQMTKSASMELTTNLNLPEKQVEQNENQVLYKCLRLRSHTQINRKIEQAREGHGKTDTCTHSLS
jgi:hypothetical protein